SIWGFGRSIRGHGGGCYGRILREPDECLAAPTGCFRKIGAGAPESSPGWCRSKDRAKVERSLPCLRTRRNAGRRGNVEGRSETKIQYRKFPPSEARREFGSSQIRLFRG